MLSIYDENMCMIWNKYNEGGILKKFNIVKILSFKKLFKHIFTL